MTDYRARIREILDEAYDGVELDPPHHKAAEIALVDLFRDLTRDLSEQVAWLKAQDASKAAQEAVGDVWLTGHPEALRFVASRYLADGSGVTFKRGRCTGVSSDALAWFAVGARDEPKPHEYPRDDSDLAACHLTYTMAPKWLQERMDPVMVKYREAVADPANRWPCVRCGLRNATGRDALCERCDELLTAEFRSDEYGGDS